MIFSHYFPMSLQGSQFSSGSFRQFRHIKAKEKIAKRRSDRSDRSDRRDSEACCVSLNKNLVDLYPKKPGELRIELLNVADLTWLNYKTSNCHPFFKLETDQGRLGCFMINFQLIVNLENDDHWNHWSQFQSDNPFELGVPHFQTIPSVQVSLGGENHAAEVGTSICFYLLHPVWKTSVESFMSRGSLV